jgi:hypothetical protein
MVYKGVYGLLEIQVRSWRRIEHTTSFGLKLAEKECCELIRIVLIVVSKSKLHLAYGVSTMDSPKIMLPTVSD